jgi:hypothetical protein
MNSDETPQMRREKPLEISASLEEKPTPIDSPWDDEEETFVETTSRKEEDLPEKNAPPTTQLETEEREEDYRDPEANRLDDSPEESEEENILDRATPPTEDKDFAADEEPEATQLDESPEESEEEYLDEEIASSMEETVGEAETEPENSEIDDTEEPEEPVAEIATSEETTSEETTSEENSPEVQAEKERSLEEQGSELAVRIAELKRQEQYLKREVASLETAKAKIQQELVEQTRSLSRLLPEALEELGRRKQGLLVEVEKLERRKERIDREMRTTFAGVSQDLAIRVQGFKDYLVGSLQDLAVAAEQLELAPTEYKSSDLGVESAQPEPGRSSGSPKFAEQGFKDEVKLIRRLLDQYRTMPDYYGPAWQLRRTFEPIHAERVSEWFFTQGGRGALPSMGSRLQNILIASAAVSVLNALYGERMQVLVLANSPERLGEWRRGLQDCLGVDRRDFGPDRGVVLFEDAELLAQKAERLVKKGGLPMIIIDDTEDKINLSMLQFPLWLAFAPEAQPREVADRW